MALHLSQYGQLLLKAGGLLSCVAGLSAFAPLAPFASRSQHTVLRGVLVLRTGLSGAQEHATSGASGHAKAEEQLDGALGSGHGRGESTLIVLGFVGATRGNGTPGRDQWHR